MAWQIDPAHSEVLFSVKHMMISTVRGKFTSFTGTVDASDQNPTGAQIAVQIDTSSIDTGNAQRDGHLSSPDFFDAAKFPQITFKSTSVEQRDDDHFSVHGDLTLRDVTKSVVLDVEYAGQAKSPWGVTSAGFSAQTKINRKDWGLGWNVALETGGWLVSDEIRISIEVELMHQPQDTATEATEEAESLHDAK